MNIIKKNTPRFKYKMGTSGCREKYAVFTADYVGILCQSIAEWLLNSFNPADLMQRCVIIGGDPRTDNWPRIQLAAGILAANNINVKIVQDSAVATTPAISYLIRKYHALGGVILTASHNPGGISGDAGLKFNSADGGPALPAITNAIVTKANAITEYQYIDFTEAISEGGVTRIDAVQEYADFMETLFDFSAIRKHGWKVAIDCMHGASVDFVREIFVQRLHCASALFHDTHKEDFGGRHPEPVEKYLPELIKIVQDGEIDLGAAYDSDGDRNKHISCGGFIVSASDLVAIIAEHTPGIVGVGRSMPTSRALDLVAKDKGIPCYETPTGWKFFVDLMEAGKLSIAGEESDGISSDHIREKDGIWATLAILQIMTSTGKTLEELNRDLWKKYGRIYYLRVNHPNIEKEEQNRIEARFNDFVTTPPASISGYPLSKAYIFEYTDLTGEKTGNQGWIFEFGADRRIIFRFSGTDTTATLRQYNECKYRDIDKSDMEVLAGLIAVGEAIIRT